AAGGAGGPGPRHHRTLGRAPGGGRGAGGGPGGGPPPGGVPARAGLPAGAVVTVWVDATGRLADSSAGAGQHDGRAPAEALVAVLLLGELLWGAGLAAHGVVDWRRLAAWDAEWRAIGPTWGAHP